MACSKEGELCDDRNTVGCDGCSPTCDLEADADADGRFDPCDNCPGAYNPSQRDRDGNGVGDSCDAAVAVATPAGTAVTVSDDPGAVPSLVPNPIISIRITYPEVTGAGVTEIRTLEAPPGSALDASFRVSGLGALLELETTAATAGAIEVRVVYDDTGLAPEEEAMLAFLHEEAGVLVDRTSRRDPDADEICAEVMSFSPFALGAPVTGVKRLRGALVLDPAQVAADEIRRLRATFPVAGAPLDPTATGVTVSLLAGEDSVFSRTIAAERWSASRSGRAFKLAISDVATSGVEKASLTISKAGLARFAIAGSEMDLRGTDTPALTLRLDVGATTVQGTATCAMRTTRAGKKTVTCKLG